MMGVIVAVNKYGAAKSAYVVLGLPWLLMFILYLSIFLFKQGDTILVLLLLASVLLFVFFWLRGFRLILSDTELTYRDGLYQTQHIKLEDIKSAKHAWVEFSRLNKDVKMPRFVIKSKHKGVKPISINTKPFVFEAVQALNELKT